MIAMIVRPCAAPMIAMAQPAAPRRVQIGPIALRWWRPCVLIRLIPQRLRLSTRAFLPAAKSGAHTVWRWLGRMWQGWIGPGV